MNVLGKSFSLFLLSILCLTISYNLHAEEEVITEIILINGLAELVDLNADGQVLQRHLSIPDYFSSGRSHKKTLRESLAKTKLYGIKAEQESQERIAFIAPTECRQSLMKKKDNQQLGNKDIFFESHMAELSVSEQANIDLNAASQKKLYFRKYFNKPIAVIRQRTMIDQRFRKVELHSRATYRTSKAIIDV